MTGESIVHLVDVSQPSFTACGQVPKYTEQEGGTNSETSVSCEACLAKLNQTELFKEVS